MGTTLRFNGSLWCNLDIVLRNFDHLYGQVIHPLGLSVVEGYILCSLYERDGQHTSELARAIGRVPTTFTPLVDKLETKHLIQRSRDPSDRRATYIHLTEQGRALRDPLLSSIQQLDGRIKGLVSDEAWAGFERILVGVIAVTKEEVEPLFR
jgi:DNA-binding MarR family transcriptional regulator